MPPNRALRMRNWVPQRDGHIELRWGYSTISMSVVVDSPIQPPFGYQLFDGTAYCIFVQADGLQRLTVSDGSVTPITIRGLPIQAFNRWGWAFAENRLYGFDTTDAKMVDGTGTARDIGLPALTAAAAAAVTVTLGAAEAQGVILTSSLAAAGTGYAPNDTGNVIDPFGAGTGGQYKVLTVATDGAVLTYEITAGGTGYTINVDTTQDAAPQPGVGTGFTINILTVSNSGLPASTVGGVQPGYQFYAAIINTVTLDVSNRMPIGDRVVPTVPSDVNIAGLPNFGIPITVTSVYVYYNNNRRTWAVQFGLSAQCPLPLGAPLSVTGLTGAAFLNGQPLSVLGVGNDQVTCGQDGSDPYQEPYGPAADNGILNGSGLNDSEWAVLIGRTIDGGESPYAVIDASGNWILVANGQTGGVITEASIDMTSLLPYRNQQPQLFAAVKAVDDRLFAALPNSPYVYYCESEADYEASGNYQFVGNGPSCWPLDNWELMPTGGAISCIGSDSQLLWVFTRNKMALLQDSAGVMTWQGEWDVGGAGWDAFTSTPYGPHWITGRKEVATMGSNGPNPISDEYERSLLAPIGDAYIGATQIAYQRDPSRNIDRLVIRCLDVNGLPFIVYHDYAIRDYVSIMGSRSPNGQGYDAQYSGPLASVFNIGVIPDDNGVEQVWGAGSNGCLYQLDSGPTDGPLDFTADWLILYNAGPNRPGLESLEWQGDSGIQWSIAKKLSMGLANFTPLTGMIEVPGSDVPGVGSDYQYQVPIPAAELKHIYIRAQLSSHGNQLLDPGFLNGTEDWDDQGYIGNDGGGNYLDLATTGNPNQWAQETNPDGTPHYFSVTPGSELALSVDIELIAGLGANCVFGVSAFDANYNLIQVFLVAAGNTIGQWASYWAYAVMPPGTAYCQAFFEIGASYSEAHFRNPSLRFMDDPRFTQNWNDPQHCPLETYGRLFLITPLTTPEIGHR